MPCYVCDTQRRRGLNRCSVCDTVFQSTVTAVVDAIPPPHVPAVVMENWKPTMHLRVYGQVVDMPGIGRTPGPTRLQQKWVNDRNDLEEWRDVPQVNEPIGWGLLD